MPPPQGAPAAGQSGKAQRASSPGGGATITLHADNLDVRKALEMVSRQAKTSILVSSGVSGMVTLDIRDKSVDETVQIIAKLCHLTVQRDKDTIYISTIDELHQGEEDNLPVRVYHLNYVRSSDVATMIKPLLSKKGTFTSSPDSQVGLPSDATGAATSGQETMKEVKAGGNLMAGGETIVVQDYEQVLRTVDRVIAQIDVQPIQVLIEAVILTVTLDRTMELGVNFAVLDGAGKTLGVIGNGAALNAAAGFAPASVLTAAGKLAGSDSGGFAEDANGVKFGWVGGSTSGFIRALESLGETKVLACPRLLVLNKQRAEIHIGKQLGYETSTVSQTSTTQTVQFMPVGTQLRLRPFVSSDGMIRMEIHPERSTGDIDANGIPQTTTAQVTTNVMIPDGATIVIGGLMDTEIDQNWEGVPLVKPAALVWLSVPLHQGASRQDGTGRDPDAAHLAAGVPRALNYVGKAAGVGVGCPDCPEAVEE